MAIPYVRLLALTAWLVFASPRTPAAALTPELQKTIRQSTFEVVLKKTENDLVSYEKPPPLDLIPYAIRSDAFWSIGTAFAIAPHVYASAAHVLLATVGSQFGAPALRDASGSIHAISKILSFSMDEDFVTFGVDADPGVPPFAANAEPRIDEAVFAVGNALGEGIVIRDGLLTSMTPEEQDGRWKWLRFSAAASPGNSGGPLLDGEGKLIGIVRAKSPNENLNYAVPIERVLKAPAAARFDRRYTTRLLNARGTRVETLQTSFELPLPYAEFARRYRELTVRTAQHDIQELQARLTDAPFPKGNSTRLLASVYDSPLPSFVQQNRNDEWDAEAPADEATQDLPDHGLVSTGNALGVIVFRLRRPGHAADAPFYADRNGMMSLLLKGLKLPRVVGDQSIRVTGVGAPSSASTIDDHLGRHWQVTVWPLGFTDSVILCYALPTPEGFAGMVQVVPSSQLDLAQTLIATLMDATYVNYSGTLQQWQSFLSRPELAPKPLQDLRLSFSVKDGLQYRSPRLKVRLPTDLLDLTADSELELRMAFVLDGDALHWDVGGLVVSKDDKQHAFVGIERHVKPRDDTAKELLETWNLMHTRGPGFAGIAGHDEDFRRFWIHEAVSAASTAGPGIDPDAQVLYDVSYMTDRSAYPHDLEESERRILLGTQVLER